MPVPPPPPLPHAGRGEFPASLRDLDLSQRLLDFALSLPEGLPKGLVLREERPEDFEFLARLYADTRAQELRPVPWSDAEKASFLREQFELQRQHYHRFYPNAQWLVIERENRAIGRLYLSLGVQELRLMDIALIADERGRGQGTALMHLLLAYADACHVPVGLHVEPYSPALRLYQRLGFRVQETRGIYLFLIRPNSAEPKPKRSAPF